MAFVIYHIHIYLNRIRRFEYTANGGSMATKKKPEENHLNALWLFP